MAQEPQLRPVRLGDAKRVLEAFTSADDMARQGDVSTLDDATAYVTRLLSSSFRAFAVVDDDELIGMVAITLDEANRNGWFWYWAHPAGRGRGWMSRAAATVANWALTDGGFHRLELGHRANHPASSRVAGAAGFIQEGTERERFLVDGERIDVLTYGRLITDPIPETPLLAWAVPPGSGKDAEAVERENGEVSCPVAGGDMA